MDMEETVLRAHEKFVDPLSEYFVYTPSTTAKQLFFYPTHIGYFQYQADYCLKRSNYHSFLLMLVLDGSCDLDLNGQSFHAKKGCLMLIDCYAPHQYGSSCGWKALWLHFDGPLARNYYDCISQKYGNRILSSEFHTICYEIKEMFRIFRSGDKINETQISQQITGILNQLLDPPSENCMVTRGPVKDAVSYINEHFAEPLTLKDLAEKACLSPFYFTRIFSEETGMTPYQYLISTRISAAKFMLKSTSLSIKEIGYQCGFSSMTSFCSTFKKWEDQTPGRYRTSI